MDRIYFTINGEKYSLGSELPPETTLFDYLRYELSMCGTKAMCHEGGCGACTVAAQLTRHDTGEKTTLAVNSCLVQMLSCNDWDISTVEGIGNRSKGYHAIQNRLADFNGTQCGYCSAGFVMNMYSLQKSKANLTTKEVEDSFGGNICRCTGFRPILDAFKTFANDVDDELKDKIQDMEDLDTLKCAKKCQRKNSDLDQDWCVIGNSCDNKTLEFKYQDYHWYKANKIEDLFNIWSKRGTSNYRLVNGNTGKGVFPMLNDKSLIIDISPISLLKEASTDANLIIGAGMTLTDVMEEFKRTSSKNDDFKYLEAFNKHIDLVATVQVRNLGTIGGNLAMKNEHKSFPSDLFLLLETVKATVTLVSANMKRTQLSMSQFYGTNLTQKLLLNIKLPPLSFKNHIRTYKIMPRAQNAHAIVNAGFNFQLDSNNKINSCHIVFGNIDPNFMSANETERALEGMNLYEDKTLQKGLVTLKGELIPSTNDPLMPSKCCRKKIALGLFYRAILDLTPSTKLNSRYVSGATMLERPISRGTQTFDTDKAIWPVSKPISDLAALSNCSGFTRYTDDVDSKSREVHLAFVLSTIFRGEINTIDTTEVLKTPGVIAVFTAKDIPGKNNFMPTNVPGVNEEEELLASSKISYHGQPLAIVAAVTRKLALRVAREVKVTYKNVATGKPVLTIQDAMAAPDSKQRIVQDTNIKPTEKGEDTTKVIKGHFTVPSQYHFTMETQTSRASVTDVGLNLHSSTQWMDLINVAVAELLGIDENKINLTVTRVGGGYGSKASRSSICACAAALSAYKLNRPARMVLSISDNMNAIGKRNLCYSEFELGVNDDGLIQYLKLTYYSETGYSSNDKPGEYIAGALTSLYTTSRWELNGFSFKTDKACNTWCRAPASTEGTAIIEHIMQRIAFATKKDLTAVKLINLNPKHSQLKEMITTFKADTRYDERKSEIDKYNTENAWKKRAIDIGIMAFQVEYGGNFPVTISVYHSDGSVAISHGGIEMGQGINTKIAQVCAYTLKIPLEKVTVKPSYSLVSPNSMASSGSITSELVSYATMKACNDLLERLEAAKAKLINPTWEEVVAKGYDDGVNLQSSYMYGPMDSLKGYIVYGVGVCEIELDVLTGNHIVTRVDLMEDTGQSLSPKVDVGQIEGAFTMGLGLWTTEHLIYDKDTGKLLTDRTWTYKPPGAKDIPVDFRITFKRNLLNPAGVLRSKATGEPALNLSVIVAHSIHKAIMEARKEFGYNDKEWVDVDTPYTVDNIIKGISAKTDYFKLK